MYEPADKNFARADDSKFRAGRVVRRRHCRRRQISRPLCDISGWRDALIGLFLISRMLEKEVAAYDAEQRSHPSRPVAGHPSESPESLHGRGTSRTFSGLNGSQKYGNQFTFPSTLQVRD